MSPTIALRIEIAADTFANATAQHDTGSKALARSLAIAAFGELETMAHEYLATPAFKAAREHMLSNPGTALAQDAALARAIRSCRIELSACEAVPLSVREAIGEALDTFGDFPTAALSLAGWAAGAREFIRHRTV